MDKSVKELHKIRNKMWDMGIENHKKYLDKETNTFDTKYTQDRACPVCNSRNELEIFYKEGGRYVKCLDCTMVYINPVFTDTALEQYYSSNHTQQSQIVENDTDNFYVTLYNGGLDSILSYTKKVSKLLDIGCSSGAFLDLAKKRLIDTYGVELNQAESKLAKEKGHKIFNDLVQNISFHEKFDAITMWDVFEHLKDGEFYLNYMKELLNDNGIIFLQIPSSDSLAAKILQEHCNMFDGIEHVNLYGVNTIKILAQKCGLDILSIKTVISEIGVINNYLSYENPYLGNTTNKEYIPNLIDENKIHESLQGYKLQIILGKNHENM